MSSPKRPDQPLGWREIVNFNSNKCLEVYNWGLNNGAAVDQWTCYGNHANQLWALYQYGNYVQILNMNSARCLEVSNWSISFGGKVDQWTCLYNNQGVPDGNQLWYFDSSGEIITNQHSGLVLEVYGSSKNNGAKVDQWGWNGGPNQLWYQK